jgi:Tfp pilus assembly protein PilF
LGRIRHALQINPESAYMWYIQGVCQAEFGLAHAARDSFERCLELSPRHADAEEQLQRLRKWSFSPLKLIRRLFRR